MKSGPAWGHGRDLNMDAVKKPMEAARDALMLLHEEEKAKLFRMSRLRDRMRGRKLAMTDILKRKLPGLRCPVDAIYGREDVLYRHALPQLEAVLRSCPSFGELVMVPEAGHLLDIDQPKAAADAIVQFLASSAAQQAA